jgi:phospholipase C
MDRRNFIKMLGLAGTSAAAYAACSNYMQEALAQSTAIDDLLSAAAHCKNGSLGDIDHVIFLMQENRSFDHYYGTLRGVRGFGDPRPLQLWDGSSVFEQKKVPPISAASYKIIQTSWVGLESQIARADAKTIKRELKQKISEVLPKFAGQINPQIDSLREDFFAHIIKGEWNSILPQEMVGKTIPELLEDLKSGLSLFKPEDIDETLAGLVKANVLSLLDNAAFANFIVEQLKTMPGSSFDVTTIKGLIAVYSGQQILGMLLPMLANLVNVDEVKKAWPAAVKALPSLATGLPKPAEIFGLIQSFARWYETAKIGDVVDPLPKQITDVAPSLSAAPLKSIYLLLPLLNISPDIIPDLLAKTAFKFLKREEIKAYVPKIVDWMVNAGHIKPFQIRRGDKSAGEYQSFGLPHSYEDGRDAINIGWNDQWMLAKGQDSMAHLDTAKDISFYHKLAQAFTICDGYHCSSHAGTDPNRAHFYTGTAGGWTNNGFFSGGLGERPDWKTYPEKLQDLKVDWKFYQNGISGDPFFGDFGDNILPYFKQYEDRTTKIAERGLSANTVLRTDAAVPSQFEKDVSSGKLPAISWINAPQNFSEHPGGISPHFGEYYVNEILKVLAANPKVFQKTVFIINYDENDGFFDHVPPPLPPLPAMTGAGKVSKGIVFSNDPKNPDAEHAVKLAQDLEPENKRHLPDTPRDQLTMGLGNRVPCLIISPWTVGGRVCSELFDHTSALRFLDAWLAAKNLQPAGTDFANVSSWRRAICGDLTSAFDFTRKLDRLAKEGKEGLDAAAKIIAANPVPAYLGLTKLEQDELKGRQPKYRGANNDIARDNTGETRKKQDEGQAELLPLGYDFGVFSSLATSAGGEQPDTLRLSFSNRGRSGVALNVYSYTVLDQGRGAWFYALAKAGKDGVPVTLADDFDLGAQNPRRDGKYKLAVHGPNGFLSEFQGDAREYKHNLIAEIVNMTSLDDGKHVRFDFGPWPAAASGTLLAINAYTKETVAIPVGKESFTTATQDGWHDVSFIDNISENILEPASTGYLRRFAGHIENGKVSKTDPAIGMKYNWVTRIYEAATS